MTRANFLAALEEQKPRAAARRWRRRRQTLQLYLPRADGHRATGSSRKTDISFYPASPHHERRHR